MHIEIWSDFACPFCYLGKRHLELALENLPFAGEVTISYKSFQLDPTATRYTEGDVHHYISKKYGISYEKAKEMNNRIVYSGSLAGLVYNFDQLQLDNTSKAHQLTKLAETVGLEKSLVNRLFKAYFEEGALLSDDDVLISLAAEAGLDPGASRRALSEKTYEAAVMADQALAAQQGIQSVPFFVVNDRYTLSGAQPVDSFISALNNIHHQA